MNPVVDIKLACLLAQTLSGAFSMRCTRWFAGFILVSFVAACSLASQPNAWDKVGSPLSRGELPQAGRIVYDGSGHPVKFQKGKWSYAGSTHADFAHPIWIPE